MNEDFYPDVQSIVLAHKYVLDRIHRCEYPRGRGSYGLICALKGTAQYRFFSGEAVTVKERDLLFLSPDTAYRIVTDREFKHYTVNFQLHEADSSLAALDKPYFLLKNTADEYLQRSFLHLVTLWQEKKSSYQLHAVAALYRLLALVYEQALQSRTKPSYRRLLAAKEQLEQGFTQELSLAHLAFLSDMSLTSFRREWKKNFSLSPLQYRDSLRLSYAKEQLNSGYYSVSEIAKKCGFEDVGYFIRFFKKHEGLTPGEYKRRALGQ